MLSTNPEYILQNAEYRECPQQKNYHDCSLFAVGVLLHIYYGKSIDKFSFTQEDIDIFRNGLFNILDSDPVPNVPDPKKFLTRNFLNYFFPDLYNKDLENDLYMIDGYNLQSNNSVIGTSESDDVSEYKCSESSSSDSHTIRQTKTVKKNKLTPNKEYPESIVEENIKVQVDDDAKKEKAQKARDSENEAEEEKLEQEDPNTPGMTEPYVVSHTPGDHVYFPDDIFQKYFITNEPCFEDLVHVRKVVREYEQESNIRLKFVKTIKGRQHTRVCCKQHSDCPFVASFGRRHSDRKVILKNFNLHHKGTVLSGFAKDGRKWKVPRQGMLDECIEHVSKIKYESPNPRDLVKTSQTLTGERPPYNVAWRALDDNKATNRFNDRQRYQLLIPYLEAFAEKNKNSKIAYSLDDNNAFNYIFVCHGDTNAKLHHVRPVITIDATFLKENNGLGTLYMATALSANNELFTIAFGISKDNENYESWKIFLKNLKESCPVISTRHPDNDLGRFAYFTFVSDRDKGLIAAMKEIFPMNHHTNCMVHIARNVLTKGWGIAAAKCVTQIGESYSIPNEQYWFALENII